jgi:hypothetical protein
VDLIVVTSRRMGVFLAPIEPSRGMTGRPILPWEDAEAPTMDTSTASYLYRATGTLD